MYPEENEPGLHRNVFVVYVDDNKDMSDARRYGKLRGVFNRPRKPYDTDFLIGKARAVLADWQPGDYLLMVGDPSLCAVCMCVIAERQAVVDVLQWDRVRFEYKAQRWDFSSAVDSEDFATAED